MEHIGIDVRKVESQICILTERGEIVECRIRSQRERFAAVLGGRAPGRILIEASTEREWVARCLEQLGHEVIVADPNFAAMYATRSRRVKTDRRDARTLAEACRRGAGTSPCSAPCCAGRACGSRPATPRALPGEWRDSHSRAG